MKIFRSLIFAAIFAIAPAAAEAENLVILHTNDTHSQFDPSSEGLGGIHRRKALVDSVRAANPERTLLIDAGDIVQGTLFFNIYKGEVEEKLMNALGYDLRILGNHEFDNGMKDLADNLLNSQATLLAANYQTIGTPLEGLFVPYDIRLYDGKRIAFFPVNLRPQGMISPRNTEGLGYIDAAESANYMAWYLRNIEQADAVVAITHIGYDDDVKIAANSHDIDVIIGGHSHTRIDPADPKSKPSLIKNADGRDVLVVQTGRGGENVGEVTFDLDNISATPSFRLISVDARFDDRLDPAVEEIIAPYRTEVDSLNTVKVAKTAKYLDRAEPELLNFLADFVKARGVDMCSEVDFAIFNKGSVRNSLPKGNITEGQIISMMPFFNRILVMEISGADVLEAFDVMARSAGNGVSREIEAIYDPSTRRCTQVLLEGKPLDPNATYKVATLDYLAQGGDYMQSLTRGSVECESMKYFFEDLLDYLQYGDGKGKTINPPSTRRFHKE